MKTKVLVALLALAACTAALHALSEPAAWAQGLRLSCPIDPDALKERLSFARGEAQEVEPWPRLIRYTGREFDFRTATFKEQTRSFLVRRKPSRILAHSVGVTEILWAICPRERIVAFSELAADPSFSFIASSVRERGPLANLQDAELVIGCRPDLVFTVFYSSADVKKKLAQARVTFLDLGYFGTVDSLREQILLIGEAIGEEGNAQALVRVMDEAIDEIRRARPGGRRPPRVLYLDANGYVPGKTTNFSSICEIIGAVNVSEEQGVTSWAQIDYETILKWDPDFILFSTGSGLGRRIASDRLLAHARAVKEGNIHPIAGVYICADSQFLVLSANALAGIVYGK
jgi:iron complex transport system substrate-binding protein